jgi:hypothetical protein
MQQKLNYNKMHGFVLLFIINQSPAPLNFLMGYCRRNGPDQISFLPHYSHPIHIFPPSHQTLSLLPILSIPTFPPYRFSHPYLNNSLVLTQTIPTFSLHPLLPLNYSLPPSQIICFLFSTSATSTPNFPPWIFPPSTSPILSFPSQQFPLSHLNYSYLSTKPIPSFNLTSYILFIMLYINLFILNLA